MKGIVIYYSYSGNTKKLAEEIAQKLGVEAKEIKTVKEYPNSYNEVVQIGKKEVEKGYKPEILPLDFNLADFDTIIVGSPVWWYTFAPAVKTFLEDNDFSGKTIYPFATNGGWIGHTFEDVEKSCKNAKVMPGLDVYFAASNMRTSQSEVDKFIDSIS